MTEDNTQLNYAEGIMTRPVIVVRSLRDRATKPDTIPAFGLSFRVIDAGIDHATPILESESEEQSGMGPSENAYYSISSGKLLFSSNSPPKAFVANGVRRYLGVAGVGSKDTLATITYGTGATPMQVVRIPAPKGVEAEREVSIDSVGLEGPGPNGKVVVGAAGKDTVAVSSVTVRIHVSISGTMSYDGDFVAHIVNDRIVLDAAEKW
jgi:hypothetical protein